MGPHFSGKYIFKSFKYIIKIRRVVLKLIMTGNIKLLYFCKIRFKNCANMGVEDE